MTWEMMVINSFFREFDARGAGKHIEIQAKYQVRAPFVAQIAPKDQPNTTYGQIAEMEKIPKKSRIWTHPTGTPLGNPYDFVDKWQIHGALSLKNRGIRRDSATLRQLRP